MSKQRDNIIFRKEWRDALKGVSAEIRAEVYEAILAYSFDGEVIEMSDVAKMAFTFIKMHIDNLNIAYEATCEKRKQSAQQRWSNASECKPMQKDANDANAYFASKNNASECKRMQTDTSECKPMHIDIDNDIDIKSSSLSKSLSSSCDEEFDERSGGLTTAERERILEVFHFERNLMSAKEECDKFINYYEANGWCRGNSSKPIKNKVALAKSWKVERMENKYPEDLREWLRRMYTYLRKIGKTEEAMRLLGINYCIEEDGAYSLFVQDKEQANTFNSCLIVVQPKFKKLIYKVPRQN